MPHQDMEDLRTPLQELKSLFALLPTEQLEQIQRHGNALVNGCVLAMTAIATFGWAKEDAVTERFAGARDAISQLDGSKIITLTRQGLLAALSACGDSLLKVVRAALVSQLEASSGWLLLGKPTFGVDGSQFAVPRTKKNLEFFAAASRKSKGAYEKASDRSKALTTQSHAVAVLPSRQWTTFCLESREDRQIPSVHSCSRCLIACRRGLVL